MKQYLVCKCLNDDEYCTIDFQANIIEELEGEKQ